MRTLMLWAATVAVVAVAGPARAEDKAKAGQPKNPDALYKASALIGTQVINERSEKLGKVEDLAIDPKSGRVVYYAVGHGGTAGVGEKLFAVPCDCAVLVDEVGKPNSHFLRVVTEKRHFDMTPGFDKNHWPVTGSDDFYGHGEQPKKPAHATAPESIVRATAVRGAPVKNPQGEDLGKIGDLMVQLSNGTISYAALNYGTTAGVGGKMFAVAWGNMKLDHPAGHPEKLQFDLEASKADLDNSPGFNKDAWPTGPDTKIGKPGSSKG